MLQWTSGRGHEPFTLEIRGSNPLWSTNLRECGGIGRRAGLRNQWVNPVEVRVLSLLPFWGRSSRRESTCLASRRLRDRGPSTPPFYATVAQSGRALG